MSDKFGAGRGSDTEGAGARKSRPTTTAASSRGSMPVGPSEDYKALLRGEITSEEYVRRLKAKVDEQLAQDRRNRGR